MIDFQNASYVKLGEVPLAEVAGQIDPLLLEDEKAYAAFKGIRDYIVFTSKRIIAVNVQGITGKKKDFTSLPFSKVQAFSIESAGTFDLDAELELLVLRARQSQIRIQGQDRRRVPEQARRALRLVVAAGDHAGLDTAYMKRRSAAAER